MSYLEKILIGVTVVLLVAFGSMVAYYSDKIESLEFAYQTQGLKLTNTLARAEDMSMTNSELQAYIEELISENTELMKDIDELKSQPVSAGRVVVVGKGTTKTVEGNFPEEWTYRLESGLPVAQHRYSSDVFTAETYDLEVTMSAVFTEDRQGRRHTYIDSTISSSATDEEFPVDIVANFAHTKPDPSFKLLDPHLNLGLSVPVPSFTPRGSLGVSISSIGPTSYENSVRFANTKIEVGKSLAVGIDPVGINVDKLIDLPLVQDTWIWTGAAVEVLPDAGSTSFTISIGSTL